jgi:hypothetical protein
MKVKRLELSTACQRAAGSDITLSKVRPWVKRHTVSRDRFTVRAPRDASS